MIVTALLVKIALTIVFAVVQTLRTPAPTEPCPLSLEQLHDLARLDAIDAKMIWCLLALLIVPLWLMAALDAPRWLAIAWLAVLGAFWVRWNVVILRYERSILSRRCS